MKLDINSAVVDVSQFFTCESAVCSNTYPAEFGEGTKLTVLEQDHEITPPKVKVLAPSVKECRNQKVDAKKKTIVCVASGFYPDHVSVFWEVDGENVTAGVATDNAALRVDKYYKITSRLRVPVKDWHTPDKKFTCVVSFFTGSLTTLHDDSVFGVKAKGEGTMTREKYLRMTQTAKFSYSVFIIKSSIYGACVAFVVWKLQRSAGKQNN